MNIMAKTVITLEGRQCQGVYRQYQSPSRHLFLYRSLQQARKRRTAKRLLICKIILSPSGEKGVLTLLRASPRLFELLQDSLSFSELLQDSPSFSPSSQHHFFNPNFVQIPISHTQLHNFVKFEHNLKCFTDFQIINYNKLTIK